MYEQFTQRQNRQSMIITKKEAPEFQSRKHFKSIIGVLSAIALIGLTIGIPFMVGGLDIKSNLKNPISMQEISALKTLFNATTGHKWKNNNGWLNNQISPCQWFGVECINGTIFGLQLVGNNLQGTIPASIEDFVHLRRLDLRNNLLHGTITHSFKSTKNLQVLLLAKNSLSGLVPDELGEHPQLKKLDISYNNLTGRIDKSFSLSTILDEVNLSNNKIFGSVPSTLALTITKLDLSNNKFTGSVPELNPLTEQINLANNQLSGQITNIMGPFAINTLTRINLSHNELEGEFTITGYQLEDLKELNISFNKFSGWSQLDDDSNSPDIKSCDASNIDFACPIPDWTVIKCKARCINQ